jgi:hypothetical protein
MLANLFRRMLGHEASAPPEAIDEPVPSDAATEPEPARPVTEPEAPPAKAEVAKSPGRGRRKTKDEVSSIGPGDP